MDINQLISIVKNKIENNILVEDIEIEDKSFLHKGHKGNQPGKFHLKIRLKSNDLKKLSKIQSTKKVYSILDYELKNYIHSIQILIT
tara:strand:+ start:1625 stop:1885 length:261 start_codon:yes stop_codon:yes gene_type:complete